MDTNETPTVDLTPVQQTTQVLQLIAAGTGAAIGLISLGSLAAQQVQVFRENRRAQKAAAQNEN